METLATLAEIPPNLPSQPPPEPLNSPRTGDHGKPRLSRLGFSPEIRPRRSTQTLGTYSEYKLLDFVWAKIENNPYWPGRIIDCKDASFLVSLFHGRTPWLHPSQLKPFKDNFTVMSMQSASRSFADAVNTAAAALAEEHLANLIPEEFLSGVRSAACDASACSLLDALMMRSWAIAFVRMNGVVVSSMADLVGVDDPKKLEITDGLPSLRKKKSVAEVISVPEITPLVPSKKRKQKEVACIDLPTLVGSGTDDDMIGSPRRERKKSKYLSPPYTFNNNGSHSFTDEEVEMGEDTFEALGQEKEGKMSALRKYASISGDVILSQLLLAASEPLHPKSNRPAKAIWGFFTEFRNFLSCRESEFENYLKSLDFSGGIDGKLMSSKFAAETKEIESAGNSNVVNAGLNLDTEPAKRGRPKKDRSVGEILTNTKLHTENDTQRKSGLVTRKKKEDAANDATVVDFGLANGRAPLGESGRKRKSSEAELNGEIQNPTLVGRVNNGSGGCTTRQTRRKKEEMIATPSPGPVHPLSYIRKNLETMILTLTGPSSDIVSAESLKPEIKENLVFEMQGLLNKVKNLQTRTIVTSTRFGEVHLDLSVVDPKTTGYELVETVNIML